MRGPPPLRVVISASPEDALWRTRLVDHLSALKRFRNVEVWTDDDVPAGVDRRVAVDRELGRADVALLLVSVSYLASDFLQDVEVPQLFERHNAGGVKVIPVLVGSCTWELHPWIGKLLPEGEQPVAAIAGDGQDRALAEVVREILRQAKVERPPVPEARGWAWHGSQGSADRGVISVLAIVETLAAMAVYGYIAVRYGTLHITVSACIAPMLLLRTTDSVALGLSLVVGTIRRLWRYPLRLHTHNARSELDIVSVGKDVVSSLAILAAMAGTVLMLLPIRFCATLWSFCRSPLEPVRLISFNWRRTVLGTDVTQSPEPLPGIDSLPELTTDDELMALDFVRFRGLIGYLNYWRHTARFSDGIAVLFMTAIVFVFVFFPVWLYRWALKGTAIIYSPILWLAHSTFSDDLRDRLQDLRELALYRLVRGYSVLVLLALASRLALDLLVPSWPSLWAGHHAAPILNAFLAPHALPAWQIAVAINALMAWALYLYADWALARYARGRPPNEARVEAVIRTGWLIRGALSIYVIGNGILAAASLARVLPAWASLGGHPG